MDTRLLTDTTLLKGLIIDADHRRRAGDTDEIADTYRVVIDQIRESFDTQAPNVRHLAGRAHYGLARVLSLQNRIEEAVEHFTFAAHSGHPKASRKREKLQQPPPKTPPAFDTDLLIETAQEAYESGQGRRAIEDLKGALTASSGAEATKLKIALAGFYVKSGYIHLAENYMAEAREEARTAADPTLFAPLYQTQGDIHFALGNAEEAEQNYLLLLKYLDGFTEQLDFIRAHISVGRLYSKIELPTPAQFHFNQAVENAAKSGLLHAQSDALLLLSELRRQEGRVEEAMENCLKATEIAQKEKAAHCIYRGYSEMLKNCQGEEREGMVMTLSQDYLQWAEEQEDIALQVGAYLLSGEIAYRNGNNKQAAHDFQYVLNLEIVGIDPSLHNPEFYLAHRALAGIYANDNDGENALVHGRSALRHAQETAHFPWVMEAFESLEKLCQKQGEAETEAAISAQKLDFLIAHGEIDDASLLNLDAPPA